MKKITTLALLAAITAGALSSAPAQAGTLENMERERSILIATLLDPDLRPEERRKRATVSERRLVDLERMVMRDDKLGDKSGPEVRRAFSNYDLTFLVHASNEKDAGVLDHWLSQLGVTTGAIMAAQVGRR
ncbi:MAG: hypothetical protein HOL85_09055 [Rhodospirillaceae bacterium]|jgi:hypothetical protein|nr:hypothetical protein [Rhodospirillaceae bacterium]